MIDHAESPPPYVSLVAPVHNGARFISASVDTIVTALETLGEPFEVIVVVDGCTESVTALAEAHDERVRVLFYPFNRGKGYAISYGIAHARGRLVGWLDSDLDIHPQVIVTAARVFREEEVDAVIGSKRHPESAVHYPFERRVLSAGYQLLVRLLFRINVRDTQVGAKLFRREMLDTVAPLLLIKRYAFDLELLAVGAEFGFDRVREIPVQLSYRFSGTGINAPAVRAMLLDTLAIGYRIHLRHWYVRQYAALQRRRMDALSEAAMRQHEAELPVPPVGNLTEIRAGLR